MKTSLVEVAAFLLAITLGLLGPPTFSLAKQSGGKPGGEAAGNNLSFPVIWSDGVDKALRGAPGVVLLDGAMWYWWGTDADGNPESCRADTDDSDYCDDGNSGSVGPAPCEDRSDPDCMAVFQQQDSNNEWQAYSGDWSDVPVSVTSIDWGDNLESVDWYTRSKVRTEVVLIKDPDSNGEAMLQYGIRHLDGWGIDELWGLATDGVDWDTDPEDEIDETVYYNDPESFYGYQATIYSDCARLTIQKLNGLREEINEENLDWNSSLGEWEDNNLDENDYIRPAILNKTVWEVDDGPGYFSAEINVKGKVIYGYTWDVKNLNDGAGDYRITFSLDGANCTPLNTFIDANTQILIPLEELASPEEEGEEPDGGATGVLLPAEYDVSGNLINGNLTYIDVRILERSGANKK